MRIIGPPSAEFHKAHKWSITRATPLFVNEMLTPLWGLAITHYIDPVGVVAQSFKETGGGRFAGKVKFEFRNTCGLKVTAEQMRLFPGITDNDNPLAHAMFPSWEIGALAHVQHVCAYAGWPVDMSERDLPLVDPRYGLVAGRFKCENWSELGSKWAPSATYGHEIENLMREIQLTP